jgi:cold shock CspA family protein
MQRIHAERGFGVIRGAKGGDIVFHRTALTPSDRFATLDVGMVVEFEAEPQRAPRHHGHDRPRHPPLIGPLTDGWPTRGRHRCRGCGGPQGRAERRAA